jgi:chaperonin GroEL
MGILDPRKIWHGAAERGLVGPLRDYQALCVNAGLLITTEAMVAELPEKDARAGGDRGHGGGMGGVDF